MRRFIAAASRDMSMPKTVIVPESGLTKPSMHSSVVVLPAPLGPSNPNISPSRTLKDTPSTAVKSP